MSTADQLNATPELAAASAATVPSNSDVWDAWPVRSGIFAETSTAARRAASDALGETAPGRTWSSRVDDALHGMDHLDPAGLDEWMQTHATSPTPEIYEARLVAAWETHRAGDQADGRADEDDVDAGQLDLLELLDEPTAAATAVDDDAADWA